LSFWSPSHAGSAAASQQNSQLLASCLIYATKWASAVKLISLTADAHFGARLGAFFYCTRFFLKNNLPLDNTTPIYLLNLLWKLGSGLGYTILAFFMENKENDHLIFREFHRRQHLSKKIAPIK